MSREPNYFLLQFTGTDHERAYGPFQSEEDAWHYLYGRPSDETDRAVHRTAKWSVVRGVRTPEGGAG